MKSFKKILAVIMTLVLVLAVVPMTAVSADSWDGTTVATAYESGDGSEANPYIIKTAAQLAYLAQYTNANVGAYQGKYFKLAADIDLGNKPWTPIGLVDFPFCGNFDGDNHTISGLFVEREDNYAGLFGLIEGSTVKNLSVLGTKVACAKYTGAVVGYGRYGCNLINLYAQVDLVDGTAAGGVVGRVQEVSQDGNNTWNEILYCRSNNTKVQAINTGATAYVGGIVGAAGHTNVRYCVNNAEVYCDSEGKRCLIGGIIAYHGAQNGAVVLDHCINTGKISTNFDAYIGGIAGKIGHIVEGKVMYCINTGEIVAENSTLKGAIGGSFAKLTAIGGYCFNYTVGDSSVLPLIGGDDATAKTCDDFYGIGGESTIFWIKAEDVTGDKALTTLKGYTSDIWKAGVTIPEADFTKVLALFEAGKWEGFEAEKPAETTTEKPAETTAKPAETTAKPAETTTAKPAETTATPAGTTAASTTAAPEKGGCGSAVSGIAIVVAISGVAAIAVKKKKER